MGIMCEILLERSTGQFSAGEAVRGAVRYALDEPTEFASITLGLCGKAKCQWATGMDDDSDVTINGREILLSRTKNILEENPATLPPALYHYPFEFILPYDIPSTFKDNVGKIAYYLEAKFVKTALFSFNKKVKKDLYIYGDVTHNPEQPAEVLLEKKLFKPFSSREHVVRLRVSLQKPVVMPGENIQLSVCIENNSDVDINGVKAELNSKTIYTSTTSSKQQLKKKKSIKGCANETGPVPREVTSIKILVPTSPDLYTIQHTGVISKEYHLNIELQLPMPHLNCDVNVPVVIGEIAGAGAAPAPLEFDGAGAAPAPSEFDRVKFDNDPPPDYSDSEDESPKKK